VLIVEPGATPGLQIRHQELRAYAKCNESSRHCGTSPAWI